MNIAEMHVWFRQYAQQMGMQNVRAILPEQIDLLINSAITDTINQVITQNIGVTNDRVITDNSKLGQINALRTVYKVAQLNCDTFSDGEETTIKRIYRNITKTDSATPTVTYLYYTVVNVERNNQLVPSTAENYAAAENKKDYATTLVNDLDELEVGTEIKCTKADNTGVDDGIDYLYLVDISINYAKSGKITNYFPVRLIDDAYLSDTLNDFILKPRMRTPIAIMYNDQLDIYIDELNEGSLPEGLSPHKVRVSYIAKPNKVKYVSDLGGTNDDCDLPEYMHVDILKHAVDLYRIAVSGSLSASQQAEQNQQRENARNNYRNEGTQQQ